jgi:hypothetical protein
MRYSGISYIACFSYGAEWADRNPAWISVKDELPAEGKEVLVYDEHDGIETAHRLHDNVWGGYDEQSYYNNITHWMPLPNEPKKGGAQ